jgi:DNA polymerase III subunit gamma/tau
MYYTKYRPQKFSELSKPNDAALALMNQIKSGKTAHAYLFVGPRGIGKTTLARILAKALNCGAIEKNGDPCGKCENCLGVQSGTFLDLIEIDAASNRGIDDIRELKDRVKLSPSIGLKKVYIIDEVHMLTKEAFNALLKTLEEPPAHTAFILCTTEFHKVPDTIKSRCQVFKFKRATKEQIVKKLEGICSSEGVTGLKKKDLEKIAEASFGGFRDAETILQQVVEGNLDPEAFVGLSSQDIYINFVEDLINGNTQGALRQINKLVEDGLDLNVWSLDLLTYLRDLLFIKAQAHEGLVDVTGENFAKMQEQADSVTESRIVVMIEIFLKASQDLNDSSIPQLPLELGVVKLGGGQEESSFSGTNKSAEQEAVSDEKRREENNSVPNSAVNEEEEQEGKTETGSGEEALQLKNLEKNWKKILAETVQYNNSIHALLKSSKPISVEDSCVLLEVGYSFHKERLEAPKNRRIVENIIKNVIGEDLRIKCKKSDKPVKKSKYASGELTDHNVKVPAISSENIAEIFDGALPL